MRYYLSNGQASIDLGECDTPAEACKQAVIAMREGPDCDWSDWYIVDENGDRH